MKIFISWSGNASQKIAEELFEWLPMVVQSVTPYMSAESIEKGTRWATSVADELQGASVGIVVLTPENLHAPWIYFEAGALAKVVDQSKLAPILFGLKPSDVGTPLSQFQVTQFNKDDFLKLLKSINMCGGEEALPDGRLEKMHEALWGDLQNKIDPIITSISTGGASKVEQKENNVPIILEELLVLSRQQASFFHSPEKIISPDVISMIIDITNDRSSPPSDIRRLEMMVRALHRRWSEYRSIAEKVVSIDEPAEREMQSRLMGQMDRILDDLLDFASRSGGRLDMRSKTRIYRDEMGRVSRRLPDGSIATLGDKPAEE